MEIKLSKPLVLEAAVGDQAAKAVEALTLNLEALTGADVEFCAREATIASGGQLVNTALVLEPAFHSQLAARACGVPVEMLRKLGAVDFLAVTMAVQSFLLGAA